MTAAEKAEVQDLLAEEDPAADHRRAQNRKTMIQVIIITVILHLLIGTGAAILVVAQFFEDPPNTFVAKKTVNIPPKIVEQRMAAAEFEAAAPKPTMPNMMSSLRPTDFALPDLPKMNTDQLMPMDPSSMVSDAVTSTMGQEGLGSGASGGTGGSGGGTMTGINFLGIQSEGKSVCILFDVSKSVLTKAERAGISFDKVREKTKELIEGIDINTTFGLIQFTRGYLPFKKELLSPTDTNKKEALAWLDKEFRTAGFLSGKGVISPRPNGIEIVLTAAFEMNPDTIFIVSDGDFQASTPGGGSENVPMDRLEKHIRELQKTRPKKAVIHFLGFGMRPEHKKELKKIVRRSKGKLKEIGED